MNSLKNTAILVFANSANEELTHKPIPKGELLFDALTQETLRKVKNTGLPYFHISEKEQHGTSFGERFTNAIQTVFNQGYDHIITIGNDTPQLKTSHLKAACTSLQSGKTVLGPSLDGGFYLLGLQKEKFNLELFKRLPWQRFSLFNRISELLHQSDALTHHLPVLGDIDVLDDVKRLSNFRKSVSAAVLLILAILLQINTGITNKLVRYYTQILLQRPFNKGSPQVLHS